MEAALVKGKDLTCPACLGRLLSHALCGLIMEWVGLLQDGL